ncbi:MAG: hypothetical protein ACI351_01530 [Candidatus Avelusimicrobium sp.]|uniref:hypothetical protein n=1 Tax=Candidatus Avelusimicrobium sp. TaxID=3048833 RepID=UPI003EFFA7D7
MRKCVYLLLSFLIFFTVSASAESFRTPFSNSLETICRRKVGMQNAGIERLAFLRYYPSNDRMPEEIGFWDKLFGWGEEEAQIRATAIYLFNMYISTACYGEDMPARLTTDYLGVLDSFGWIRTMYKTAGAEKFYKDHKMEIKERLFTFFNSFSPKNYQVKDGVNDRRELAFMRLLSNAPIYFNRPAYYYALGSRMSVSLSEADKIFLSRELRRNLEQNKNKVVTFESASVRMEDLDRKVGVKSANINRTYRYVNDECAYCSYQLCRRLCRAVTHFSSKNGKPLRVYKITAAPLLAGGALIPAKGSRFQLSSGQMAPKWNYHTASLVVLMRDGRYVLAVSDNFLAGDKPMVLDEWMKFFAPSKTMFYIAPFSRSRPMEDAMHTPQAKQGKSVKVNGHYYEPEPVVP